MSSVVFWLVFGTLKGPNGFYVFLVPRLGPRKLKINLGNPSKVLRKAPTLELETQSRAVKTHILP